MVWKEGWKKISNLIGVTEQSRKCMKTFVCAGWLDHIPVLIVLPALCDSFEWGRGFCKILAKVVTCFPYDSLKCLTVLTPKSKLVK